MLFQYNIWGYDKEGYDRDGYNEKGWDRNGFDKSGFDKKGYDKDGYDRNGWDASGYSKNGYNQNGFSRSGYDAEGYDYNGMNENGYTRNGFDKDGFDRSGYDAEGYNRDGFNVHGFNRNGYNRKGFDVNGYDQRGYNISGFDKSGYNEHGMDQEGYARNGFNQRGLSRDDKTVCPECHHIIQHDMPYCVDCGCPMSYIEFYNASHEIDEIVKTESILAINTTKVQRLYDKESYLSAIEPAQPIVPDYPINMKLLSGLFFNYDFVVFFDTETSGLDFVNDTIVELAFLKFEVKNGAFYCLNKFDEFLTPPEGLRMNPTATQVNGITDAMLQISGICQEKAADTIGTMLGGGKTLLIAYNANFDLTFLDHYIARNNIMASLALADFIDALTVFKDRRQYPHKLANAVDAYQLGSIVKNSHRAIDDTQALLFVVNAMAEEKSDLEHYINLFGYNPKYGISGERFSKIEYKAQPYSSTHELYDRRTSDVPFCM